MQEWVQLCHENSASSVEVWANPFENTLRCADCDNHARSPLAMAEHLAGHLDSGALVPQPVLTYVAERCYDWIGRKLRVRD